MPEHTVENNYKADAKVDKSEDKNCSKIYNSKSDITGGKNPHLLQAWCSQGLHCSA